MQIFVKSFGGVRLYFSGEGKRVKKANNRRLEEFLYFVRGILRVGCRRMPPAATERCLPATGNPGDTEPASDALQ
ncbi:jg18476 [Pararge aegeria aegeria]|uniref:Jg18476 protein n=1 Tax=Pararge aegeria aegeria TaxID=348720 RepID=A0A8S4RPQ9_9NEOP|nr:jg18476 [Pararge aegeria aegeria]